MNKSLFIHHILNEKYDFHVYFSKYINFNLLYITFPLLFAGNDFFNLDNTLYNES